MREQSVDKNTPDGTGDYPRCGHCSEPLMPSRKRGVCETCRFSLAEELGLPQAEYGETGIFIVLGNRLALGRDAYRVGLFGTQIDTRPTSGPCYAPFARAEQDAEGNTTISSPWGFWQIWLAEAAYLDPDAHTYTPLYAQMLWRPGRANEFSIQGFERTHTAADEKRARESLIVLQGIVKRMGRPRGSTMIRDSKQVVDAYSEYIAQYGGRPSQEELAHHMGFSDASTLKRFIRSSMSWPPRP